MTQIKLHGFAPSTYTRSACMAAIEKGVSYQLVPVEFGKPSHLELHPFAKLPILSHDGTVVFETLAIISYLDANFEGQELIPTRGSALVQTLTATSVAIDYAYRQVVHAKIIDGVLQEDQKAPTSTVFDWLETTLISNEFASGPRFGAADILLAPMISYHIGSAGKDHVIDARPALGRWFQAMTRRPSFLQTASD